ncbi:hypothetical protein Misp01_23140 [Microtetraspora sp. NBRC 13810]|uniref:ATP-binding protein n=1 Tax=Microtetraspora sp. NBRC 13810 TaxID=3030990 RepID=UPI0024A1D8D7|nr:ATP-binding protein [Microtetraspora sp. NBRC 13810]GLW07184.1 hypothetical protein Misp01_23140 [Microtetraspora sp. NBRC 13810]
MTAGGPPGAPGDRENPEGTARQWPITRDLDALRDRVRRHAARAGLDEARTDDLMLAVNEAAINVLEHAGAHGTVAIWQDADALTVDITDGAGRLSARHVPAGKPLVPGARGYGLWLMCTLCDEFTVHQQEGRSRVRLRMALREPGPAGGRPRR